MGVITLKKSETQNLVLLFCRPYVCKSVRHTRLNQCFRYQGVKLLRTSLRVSRVNRGDSGVFRVDATTQTSPTTIINVHKTLPESK